MAKGAANLSCLLWALVMVFAVADEPFAYARAPNKKDPASAFRALDEERVFFKNDLESRKYRNKYEALIKRFQSYATKWPTSEKAGQALIFAAQLSEDVAQITRSRDDFAAAVHAYLVVVQKYPGNLEADEALFRAVILKKGPIHDKAGALKLFKQFLPNASAIQEKYPQSRKLLAALLEHPLKGKKAAPAVLKTSPQKSEIQQISIQESEKGSRVRVIGLEKPSWQRGEIAKNADMPRRIFLDLSPARLANIPLLYEVNQGKLLKVRVGKPKNGVVRLVLEVEDDANVLISAQDNSEIILDLSNPAKGEKKAEAVSIKASKKEPEFLKKEAISRPKIIVIDPGHGGDDPGTIGHRGLQEKRVTLEIAKRVKRAIEDEMPGVRVFLTRHYDQTVSLSRRTDIANELEADLFVSIHANAAPNIHAQGIETYYLNSSHDRYAIRLAARENAMSETEISNLGFILADLAMKANVTDSIRLGQVVQSSMCSKVKERWDDTKDLGLKHALFYVLMGVRMPAILVETSFISNKQEEKRLKSDAYQRALALGVAKGIKRYMEEQQAMYVP